LVVLDSEIDGPQPTRDGTKFIIFIKTEKKGDFLEIATPSDENAKSWIEEARNFTGRLASTYFDIIPPILSCWDLVRDCSLVNRRRAIASALRAQQGQAEV